MGGISDTVRYYQRIHSGGRSEVDFFEFVRRVEAASGERMVGKSAGRLTEPVRFGQVPHLNYASTAIAEIMEREKLHILVNFFGLWGPNGPMPLAASEYVHNRAHNCYDQTLRRFADIIHHRFLGLYYRSWKVNELAVSLDKGSGGFIPRICDALTGSACRGTDLPTHTAAAFGSQFGLSVKSMDGLKFILSRVFGLPFHITEKVVSESNIPEDCRSRLGRGGVSELGCSVQLGSRFRTRTRKFVLLVKDVDFDAVVQFFPGMPGGRQLVELVQAYLDRPLEWDLKLNLRTASLPAPVLNGSHQLGRAFWLGRSHGEHTDVVLGMSRLAEARHAHK